MTSSISRVVVVGAGHAGVQAADALRREGFAGGIVLIGGEQALPYQRPPLSKKFLLGELSEERLALRPAAFYTQHDVDLRLGISAGALDAATRRIQCSDGQSLGYDRLILCIGSRVRRLTCPGAELTGVHYVRTIDDIRRLQPACAPDRRAVVIGAGYIGLETAASLRKLGLQVTVLELAERCLNRVTSPIVSNFYAQRHAQAGVDLRVNTGVVELRGDDRVRTVVCDDGSELAADIVVVGIGIVPNSELAQAAGLRCDNGIVVDEFCRTSEPHIYAAGDCTHHPSVRYGRSVRLESVDNAVEQARVAAAHICGKSTPHAHTPWFWSDQYDVKLQTAGLLQDYDRHVVRGDPQSGRFSVWYLRQGELLAVDAVNRAGDFILGKRWIGERKHPDPDKLADPTIELKQL